MLSDPAADFRVDGGRLELPAEWLGVLDVEFDGHRVLSIDPAHHPVRGRRLRRVSWPLPLRPFLTGSTELTLRPHQGGPPLIQRPVAFDDAPGRVAVVDSDGNWLAADKLGRLSPTFATRAGPFVEELLDDLEALLADVTAVLSVPSYLAYGGLLGAVREGTFIGHDNDVDISYLSAHSHPADIARESFALRRGLRERGWSIHASTATFLQLLRRGAPAERRIDIFTSYFIDDSYALDCWVRGPLERSDIVPLGEVTLAGRRIPAPAVPEKLLALTYGPHWRVPDPAFRFVVPASTTARAFGWFGRPVARHAVNVPVDQRPPGPDEVLRPTEYARWVHDQQPDTETIIDLRQGIGHDSTWWAEQGRTVIAVDVKDNSRTYQTDRLHLVERLQTIRLPLTDVRRVLTTACLLAGSGDAPMISLGSILPTLTPSARANLWRLVEFLLPRGGQVLLETADGEPEHLLRAELAGRGAAEISGEARTATPAKGGTSVDAVRLRARWSGRLHSAPAAGIALVGGSVRSQRL